MTLSTWLPLFLCKRGHLQHLLDALWLSFCYPFSVLIVSFMGLPSHRVVFLGPHNTAGHLLLFHTFMVNNKGHSFLQVPRKKWSSNWRIISYLLLLAVDTRVISAQRSRSYRTMKKCQLFYCFPKV